MTAKSAIAIAYIIITSVTFSQERVTVERVFCMFDETWHGLDFVVDQNRSIWQRRLTAAFANFDMYYFIGAIDKIGLDQKLVDQYVNFKGVSKLAFYSIIDDYISSPEKLQRMNEALDVLRMYVGGLHLDDIPFAPISSPLVQEGCFSIQLSRILFTDNPSATFAYLLATANMNPYSSVIQLYFPEKLQVEKKFDFTPTTITISNVAVTDCRQFPPCTLDCETEEECLEDLAVKAIQ